MTILIGYSTVFGTSASYAEKLEKQFDDSNIQCLSSQIDAFGNGWLQNYKGIIILLLSTTGNGQCPPNAIKFYQALKQCQQKKQTLQDIKFAIIGYGSTIYPNFCGFAKQIQYLLINLGAIQLKRIQYCDSNLKANLNVKNQKKTNIIFNKWKKQLLLKIKQQNENSKSQERNEELTSEITKLLNIKKLKKLDQNLVSKIKILNSIEEYNKLPKARVVEIKQLRQKNESQTQGNARSTLHIKLQKNSDIKLTPGCVINIYPENSLTLMELQSQSQDSQLIRQIIKRIKINQPATRELINLVFNEEQNFTNISKEEKLLKYKKCLINKNLTVEHLIKQFKPKNLNFYAKLSLEPPRSYSLCSWDSNHQSIELCVSMVPNGVTSRFLQTNPEQLKFSVLSSGFKLLQNNEPIMMICNGTGIAPFRSIAQFYAQKNNSFNEPSLTMFYGIQNQNTDYYFKQQWKDYQRKGFIDMKVAQSRRNPEQKEYVQNIIDTNTIYEHLFMKKGLIYICGGSGMAEGVKKLILQSIRSQTKNEGQINSLYQDLKMRSIIVEEIFH